VDGLLAGKRAVITGAAGHLGKVWADAMERAGATVERFDVRESPGVKRMDIRKRSEVEAAFKGVGAPDILVNCAGVDFQPTAEAPGGLFKDMTYEQEHRVIETNILGTETMLQVFGQAMADSGRGGSVINIGSILGVRPPDNRRYREGWNKPPSYGASKAAIHNLTRYCAGLWGQTGVRVNTLSPGGVFANQDPEFIRRYTDRLPMGRMANDDDVVGPLLFLASDLSLYVTGVELMVDGGFTAW
jgi:NAD(P)-dependent dehydrogenase (short-subunit alcohol dehydrogenase family)